MRTYGPDWYMHDVRTINGVDATYERTYHIYNIVLTRRKTQPTKDPNKLPIFTPPRREGLRFTRPKYNLVQAEKLAIYTQVLTSLQTLTY